MPDSHTAPDPEHDRTPESADASAGLSETVERMREQVRAVEQRPLHERAEAYQHVHDELAARLEGADQVGDPGAR